MPRIITIEEMVAIEKASDKAGHSYAAMMDAAGLAVAERILLNLPEAEDRAARVFVLVGPGNNGGDGLVAARYVKTLEPETEVTCYLLKGRDREDEVFAGAQDAGVFMVDYENDKQNRVLKTSLAAADVFVDALFGTGTRLPIEGDAAKLLKEVNGVFERRQEEHPDAHSHSAVQSPQQWSGAHVHVHEHDGHVHDEAQPSESLRPFVIAVDCPSGLDCDTGAVDEKTIAADETITFAAAKIGQFAFPGANYAGELFVADIGIPDKELKNAGIELIDARRVRDILPTRSNDSHKGTFGKSFIVAGSVNYIGAAYLSASAAYRVGAGLVTLGVPQSILSPLAVLIPEATWILLPNNMGVVNRSAADIVREEIDGYTALLVGCGIGDEDDTLEFMESLLQPEGSPEAPAQRAMGLLRLNSEKASDEKNDSETGSLPPLVIDADGLNVLSKIEHWWKLIPENTILTPHPKEFARLADIEDTKDVLENRVQLAQEKAKEWKAIVVLKGAYTVIAAPDGRTAMSPFASAKLATAGTGDVLAGTIVGLLTQGVEAFEAASAGVWLHAWAGTYGTVNYGVVASDVMYALGEAIGAARLG